MGGQLEGIQEQINARRDYKSPPLHLWHPPLSGDIAIRIEADGQWYHEGSPIVRDSLVRLFASILRREEDGCYYLVTPAEKWRIEVALHPLLVTDIELQGEGEEQVLFATLNTGKTVAASAENPLFLEPAVGDIAAITLDHGLSALFSRSAWYRLVDMAEDVAGVTSVRSSAVNFALVAN